MNYENKIIKQKEFVTNFSTTTTITNGGITNSGINQLVTFRINCILKKIQLSTYSLNSTTQGAYNDGVCLYQFYKNGQASPMHNPIPNVDSSTNLYVSFCNKLNVSFELNTNYYLSNGDTLYLNHTTRLNTIAPNDITTVLYFNLFFDPAE